MGTVTIYEYCDLKRSREGAGSDYIVDVLATDMLEVTTGTAAALKTVTTVASTAVDSAALSPKTHFVVVRGTAAFHYRVRPEKGADGDYDADTTYRLVAASTEKTIAVYPGAVISFYEVAA